MKTRPTSFAPIADARARILILGTLPGEASLRARQYYAHPRNHFWPIMGALFGAGPELPYDQRTRRLRAARVALWDVVAEADRAGSEDAAIRAERPNDIPGLLAQCPRIRLIAFNGQPAARLFRRHFPDLDSRADIRCVVLPSTSPAHATRPAAEKCARWRIALRGASD